MKTRKLLSVIIMLATVLSLSNTTVFVSAEETQECMPFLYYNDLTKEMCKSACTDYELLDSDTKTWESGKWYVAKGEIIIDGRVTVSDEAYLILKDGCKLTVNGGINVDESNSLTIFSQSEGTGVLIADAGSLASTSGIVGTVNVYGGNITADGGYESNGIRGTANVYCGKVIANGDYAAGMDGSINIYGGNVFANGGEHCAGINGSLTTYGGNVIANSGDFDGTGISGSISICGGTISANVKGYAGMGISGSIDVAADISLINMNDGSIYTKGDGQKWNDVLGSNSVSICALNLSEAVSYQSYDEKMGKFAEKNSEDYRILNKSMNTLESGCYLVMGVHDYSGIAVSGDVELILADWCDWTLNGEYKLPGVDVGKENSLTVYAQSGGVKTGKLTANGSVGSAGIGGFEKEFVGTVNIHGGKISANGGSNGAGIGGGDIRYGGTTNIYGGDITASGGDCGAGIGGGNFGPGGTVNIRGGKINAIGGLNGAGIGGGSNGSGNMVNIYDGDVTATGGSYGAGIGGGFANYGGTVNIYGGNVTANGGLDCIAIGNGQNKTEDKLNTLMLGENLSVINNTTGESIQKNEGQTWIDAVKCPSVSILSPASSTGTEYLKYYNGKFVTEGCEKNTYVPCPDISLWQYDWYEVCGELALDAVSVQGNINLILKDGCTLTVNGGIEVAEGNSLTIYAQSEGENKGRLIVTGGNNSAGIGGKEYKGSCGDILIHGGYIRSDGGSSSAGIGGGLGGNLGNIKIYGGEVEATGGGGGAGIGTGVFGSVGGNVEIFGGEVTATGATSAQGIGHGNNGSNIGSVAIYGGKITANGVTGESGICGDTVIIGSNMEVYNSEDTLIILPDGCSWCDLLGRINSVKVEERNSLVLDITDNTFNVMPRGKNAGTGVVIVAMYDSEKTNRLVEVKIFDIAKGETPFGTFDGDGSFIKAMWWSDLNTKTALCEAKCYPPVEAAPTPTPGGDDSGYTSDDYGGGDSGGGISDFSGGGSGGQSTMPDSLPTPIGARLVYDSWNIPVGVGIIENATLKEDGTINSTNINFANDKNLAKAVAATNELMEKECGFKKHLCLAVFNKVDKLYPIKIKLDPTYGNKKAYIFHYDKNGNLFNAAPGLKYITKILSAPDFVDDILSMNIEPFETVIIGFGTK